MLVWKYKKDNCLYGRQKLRDMGYETRKADRDGNDLFICKYDHSKIGADQIWQKLKGQWAERG